MTIEPKGATPRMSGRVIYAVFHAAWVMMAAKTLLLVLVKIHAMRTRVPIRMRRRAMRLMTSSSMKMKNGTCQRPQIAPNANEALSAPAFLFLVILATGYFGVGAIRRKRGGAERAPPTHDLALYVRMSWVAFIINGAFLSVAYYPHLFVLGGISSALIACHKNIDEPAPAKPSRHASQASAVRWSRSAPEEE